MNILLICGWKVNDVLTVSTLLPHLEVLVELRKVSSIVLLTNEESSPTINLTSLQPQILRNSKVKWLPRTFSNTTPFKLINQAIHFTRSASEVSKIIKNNGIDVIVAHGAPAGAIAYKVWEESKIPFFVSLFEPHADYMLESGVWSRYGLKYIFQKKWEKKQLTAAGLMPVTENYSQKIIADGVRADKVFTVPCSVQANIFSFNSSSRDSLRTELGWRYEVVGIYVGKYGGLYLEEEAFSIYKSCFKLISNFRLVILTPQPELEVYAMLDAASINRAHVLVRQVPHSEVPSYLSAADFAFATYKAGPSKKALSPVKIGEYWANGLPVLLTEGVGDDSDIIKQEGGGALFNLQRERSVEEAILQILEIIKDPKHRQEIPKLAHKYRSPEKLREAYEYFFGASGGEAKV
ncbi:glycosyltransferase [Pontibacter cellulosilyticus]|uniref:Glycosyltransferase n=1 Tax=Pontibacter cellulosilyticus TaxID=1720253 RepID=A0A923SNX2_9BACT|nr:glycosyltransferase [Pontibacter cellulosilyticus]MBC5993610.1 glycosyltransferase [Pontibacter cellulosilyticus]